jgi:MoaA/NifB/PqqE/SkfB family radical SAM enzyme
MSILRARTLDLKETTPLTEERKKNSKKNEQSALEGREYLDCTPRRLVLEMTNACNINCIMCGRNAADFKPTMFDIEWLKYFEPITDKLEEVTLLGWGEPTLHPQFSEFLKWADERGLRKFFCTNGTRLDSLKEDIFRYHVDLVTVSLDGARSTTNNRIRVGADFETITRSIREIVEEKKRRGTPYPYMSIVMTLMKSNYHEFPEFVRLAHDLGLEEAKGVYLTVFADRMMPECMEGMRESVKAVFEEAAAVGEELGVNVKIPYLQGDDIAGENAHKECYVGWRDFFLGSDGFVRSCMSTSEKLFHVSRYNTFAEMWNAEEYQDFRKRVNTENMDTPCRNCYQASFANWNKRDSFIQVGNKFSPDWERTERNQHED